MSLSLSRSKRTLSWNLVISPDATLIAPDLAIDKINPQRMVETKYWIHDTKECFRACSTLGVSGTKHYHLIEFEDKDKTVNGERYSLTKREAIEVLKDLFEIT